MSMTPRRMGIAFAAMIVFISFAASSTAEDAPTYGYEVINVYPHDAAAFTQGLVVADSVFYEGTGLYGESSLRKVDIETGTVLKQYDVHEDYFGEGITAFADTIYQLTYQENVAFTYVESDTFEVVDVIPYEWDGWGLTHDGTHLIASDGTSTIRFLDPRTLEEVSQIVVQDDGREIAHLNELEYIEGRIYSNIWYVDEIAVINPNSGTVEAWLDLGGLADSVAYYPPANVLNGIAYDPEDERLFVTGKWWPKLFEIDVPTLSSFESDEIVLTLNEIPRLRCFPNPARRSTSLTFTLPRSARVALHLYDSRGRLVKALFDERRPAGRNVATLDLGLVNPGVYFARVLSEEASGTTKIHVVR